MKSLIIAADDYAQSEEVDAGILSLIQMQRVTATSCLTLSPRWTAASKNLTADIRVKADIGLHLDFTNYDQAAKYRLSTLMLKSLGRLLPINLVRDSIKKQLDLFEDALNFPPDYIDGHQHVHQLPQIREVLIAELSRRYSQKMPWVRIAKPPVSDGLKAVVIGLLGAQKMKELLQAADIRHTDQLLGVYDFDLSFAHYAQKFKSWLALAETFEKTAVLMVHPAIKLTGKEGHDPHFPSRLLEYQLLSSAEFSQLLQAAHLQMTRGSAANLTS
jgi:predicted glycoside hydrolase/deacetylase ChbG (UPF0249 family)